jgi:hypothetical protein
MSTVLHAEFECGGFGVPFECAFEPLFARFDGRAQHITML